MVVERFGYDQPLMRRSALIAVVLAGLLAGCGGSSESRSTGPSAQQQAEEVEIRHRRAEEARLNRRVEANLKRWAKEAEAEEASAPAQESEPEPAATEPAGGLTDGNPADACGDFSDSDAAACESSYAVCLLNAKEVVTAYYREEPGADLNQYAESYAANEYGASGSSEQAAYVGCLGALFDEYDALYR